MPQADYLMSNSDVEPVAAWQIFLFFSCADFRDLWEIKLFDKLKIWLFIILIVKRNVTNILKHNCWRTDWYTDKNMKS